MVKNVRETIKSLTRRHLNNGGRCFGQCLTAVGWVGGTLPELYEEDGMVELSMADVAGGAIATGIALAGERPIYVVRYQGFQWYNAPSIVNYAAKSKEIWGVPCPIFVRSIAMEGGVGPVAGSSHHSIYDRMPGLKIASPMTPREYEAVYESFMNDDVPYYVSEHRKSYDNAAELEDFVHDEADITLLPISVTRFAAVEARQILESMGYKVNIVHQLWIKPFAAKEKSADSLARSKCGGILLDDDYEQGVASSLAHQLMLLSKKEVHTLCIENRTAGFHPDVDVFPPNKDKIVEKALSILST